MGIVNKLVNKISRKASAPLNVKTLNQAIDASAVEFGVKQFFSSGKFKITDFQVQMSSRSISSMYLYFDTELAGMDNEIQVEFLVGSRYMKVEKIRYGLHGSIVTMSDARMSALGMDLKGFCRWVVTNYAKLTQDVAFGKVGIGTVSARSLVGSGVTGGARSVDERASMAPSYRSPVLGDRA